MADGCRCSSHGLECRRSRKFCADAEFKGIDEERRKTMENSRRLRVFLFVLNGVAMLMSGQVSEAQDRSQGRSMVVSRNGIVAAESQLAAQAGARILERGGNAVDAAIATNAMMGVVEPMMNGIGGDLFGIIDDSKAGKVYWMNASGWEIGRATCREEGKVEGGGGTRKK